MSGQGCFEVLDVGAAEVVGVVVVELVDFAEAPAMPTAAPPGGSAPVTIVALSILDMCMVVTPYQWVCGGVPHHARHRLQPRVVFMGVA
jgi:hypothetical protein